MLQPAGAAQGSTPSPGGGGPGAAGTPADAGGAGSPPGAGGLTLAATPPQAVHLASEDPGAGNIFLAVRATLTNGSITTPLPTSPASFTLELSNHLVVSAWIYGVSAVANTCDGNLAVAKGGSATCAVVFAVPDGATPVSLHYADGLGDLATAPIAAIPSGPSGARVCGRAACDAATQDCCGVPGADAGASCVPRGTCTSLTISCESAANCGVGMVCCLTSGGAGGATGAAIACEANACVGGHQVCATSAECVSGSCRLLSGSKMGTCGP